MIQVLVDTITPRVEYAVSLVLKQVLHVDYSLIDNCDHIGSCCINYTQHPAKGAFNIPIHSLLSENDIHIIDPAVSEWRGLPVFFRTDESQAIPFDIFAASFWLATRYEEYYAGRNDSFGRYPAQRSHAFRNGYLQKPVVNLWAAELRKELQKQFPQLVFTDPEYRFVPTVDIDSMFKYRNKGFVRNTGGFFRDLFRGEFKLCASRIAILTGRQDDPWDNLTQIVEKHKDHNLNPLFFILCAAHTGNFDKNISPSLSVFSEKINLLQQHHRIGIHPSYAGHYNNNIWEQEIKTLSQTIGKPVYESRMHFLKLHIPFTYRELIRLGIEFDFSLGYAEAPGFRAGLCTPFFFYDLADEVETTLSVVSLSIMDVSMKKYLNLNYNDAIGLIDHLYNTVKSCGGVFVSLWHNETFADEGEWNRVYEYLLEKAAK